MARPCPAVTDLRKPFLVVREAAFFLQVRPSRAHYMFERGQLPAAKLEDGSAWMPFDKRLIRAIDFYALLDERARDLFVEWQLGACELPTIRRGDQPPPFSAVLRRADA